MCPCSSLLGFPLGPSGWREANWAQPTPTWLSLSHHFTSAIAVSPFSVGLWPFSGCPGGSSPTLSGCGSTGSGWAVAADDLGGDADMLDGLMPLMIRNNNGRIPAKIPRLFDVDGAIRK